MENETIIKKWGQLNLSSHRLWIESGDDDNYFLNSIELYKIQGHSIIKYSNSFLLTMAIVSFFMSPLSVLLLKFASNEFAFDVSSTTLNFIFLGSGIFFLLIGGNFFWKYQTTRSLTLNFQAGARNIYFRLTDEFARIEDALLFSNLVDAQVFQLKVKADEPPDIAPFDKTVRTFKIS